MHVKRSTCSKVHSIKYLEMTSMNYSITAHTDGARYSLITWSLLTLLLGLAGNIVILLATTRYRALRLDKIINILIKNIAVSDLGTIIFAVLPSLISLIQKKWLFGKVSCYVCHYAQLPIFTSSVLLICALQISKLHTLIYPLHFHVRSNRFAHKVIAIIWLLSAILPTVQFLVDKADIIFDTIIYRCKYSFSSPVWGRLLPPLMMILFVIPNLIVIGTTISLLVVLKKARGRTSKNGVLTSLYVGGIYLLSSLPVTLYSFLYKNFEHIMSPELRRFFEYHVFIFAFYVMFLNVMSNFFVYFVSLDSFNKLVKRIVFLWIWKIPCFRRENRWPVTLKLRALRRS